MEIKGNMNQAGRLIVDGGTLICIHKATVCTGSRDIIRVRRARLSGGAVDETLMANQVAGV